MQTVKLPHQPSTHALFTPTSSYASGRRNNLNCFNRNEFLCLNLQEWTVVFANASFIQTYEKVKWKALQEVSMSSHFPSKTDGKHTGWWSAKQKLACLIAQRKGALARVSGMEVKSYRNQAMSAHGCWWFTLY